MGENPLSLLSQWGTFYTTTGTAAASLVGLVFVVITLVTSHERARRSREATAAYTTPTVVHFAAALFVSAVLSAPWHSLLFLRIVLCLACLWGVLYVLRTASRMKGLDAYTADAEDWTWHTILPLVAYGSIVAGALFLPIFTALALFVVAGAVVTLLFVGIHNAWDIVTYVAIDNPDEQ